jgi:hypothetical protein
MIIERRKDIEIAALSERAQAAISGWHESLGSRG